MKKLLFLWIIFFLHNIQPAFIGQTLIHSHNGVIPIEALRSGNLVACHTPQYEVVYRPILHTQEVEIVLLVQLIIDGTTLYCSANQLFYLPEEHSWADALNLKAGQFLLDHNNNWLQIESIGTQKSNAKLYELSIDEHHSFFVSSLGILAHNIPVAVVLAAPAIEAAIIATVVETTAAFSLAAGCAYSFFTFYFGSSTSNKKLTSKSPPGNNNNNNRCWCGHYCGSCCSCGCNCFCSSSKNQLPQEYTYEHGKYIEDATYHHKNSTGNSKNGKSPVPRDGQKALDNSIKIPGDG